jgi:hypothetical protein
LHKLVFSVWRFKLFFRGAATCPLCSQVTNSGTFASISPWVRELGIKARVSKYYLCNTCDTGFFSKRYSDKEMSEIYKDYRGSNYLKVRSKWEPWYTKSYNSNHDSGDWVDSRKSLLTEFLLRHGVTFCDIVVDVGGDQGQYIPDFAKTKIVIDISEKKLSFNIKRINKIENSPFANLIIYAHVLEHVVNPIKELEELFKKTDQVYVEVPFGIPEINKYRLSLRRFFIQQIFSLSPMLWARSARPATGRKVTPTKMLAQSEHLTFFSEKSFNTIAEVLGVDLLIERNMISTPDFNTSFVLQCLLTRRQ